MISVQQGTLKEAVSFVGVGIHTGCESTVTVRPSPENTGRRFLTPNGTQIPARVDYVVSCDRSTVLGKDQERVHTPEHLLSALVAAGVDNALIEMSGPEVPILDGSAAQFFQKFREAGVERQAATARTLVPSKPYLVHGPREELVLVLPAQQCSYEYCLYYDHPMLGCQSVHFDPIGGDYAQEIAPARTFALWEEVQPLIERGLARGGDLSNALVVYRDKYSSDLKVDCEPVRHKCLDLIGDFALLDARIQARVLAVKAGHRWHIDCAKKVWEEAKVYECT